MGGPEPAHLSFSYTKHQLCVCGGGGGGLQRSEHSKATKHCGWGIPPHSNAPIQNRCCPVCSARRRWKVWGAQHVLACTACQGLPMRYAWPLGRWQHPPYPSLHAWHQLVFHTVSLCTETTGPHHDFSLSGEQREKWKDTTNYFLPFLSNLSLRVLFTYKCFLCTPLWPFKASLSLILPNVM